MNTSFQKWLYGVLIIIFLTVILGAAYYQMGGFEEVKVYRLEPTTRLIAGKYFYTKFSDQALQEHFDTCAEIVLSGDIDGVVTTVDYLPDSLDRDMRLQFIGITLNKRMAEIPQGFEVREYVSKERFAVFLSMNPIVRPRIPTIEKMLEEEAQNEGLELGTTYFRLRYPDNSISIEGWVD